jgi:outer membrane murein-binding lipoprotein Lpp
MAQISARDLRRFEALEGRLRKTQDERKDLAAERRELRAAVAANARQARALEKDASAAEEKLEAVLSENAALAARLDEVKGDLERLDAASLELRVELDAVRADLQAAQQGLARAEEDARAARAERGALAESLKLANEQLAGKSIEPVLLPRDVAKLVDGLLSEFSSGLPGMSVRDGEVRLRVAFGKVAGASGFVVPSAESPPDLRENLHEVAIRFDRTLELPEGRA